MSMYVCVFVAHLYIIVSLLLISIRSASIHRLNISPHAQISHSEHVPEYARTHTFIALWQHVKHDIIYTSIECTAFVFVSPIECVCVFECVQHWIPRVAHYTMLFDILSLVTIYTYFPLALDTKANPSMTLSLIYLLCNWILPLTLFLPQP